MLQLEGLEEALATLGELLAERGQHVGLLVVGGSSLLLLGIAERPTADVDVVGFSGTQGYVQAREVPAPLKEAVEDVGNALGLGAGWLNVGPAGLLDFGLPVGLEDRVEVLTYGALEIHLPSIDDMVCFKLYAAVDQTEKSKHFQDLQRIAPTRDQLLFAARWTRTHDPSPGFLKELRRVLELLDVEVSSADLN
jgi:hypothetical protein